MMKLIDAMRRVDRSEKNQDTASPVELNTALDTNFHYVDWDGFQEDVREYWLYRTLCSDTHVGGSVGYIGDEPVYLRRKAYRRGTPKYEFVSVEAAEKIKALLAKHSPEDEITPALLSMDEEIDESYSPLFSNALVSKHGFYEGRAATHNQAGWYDSRAMDIFVVIDETGERISIPCAEFKVPLHLSKEG